MRPHERNCSTSPAAGKAHILVVDDDRTLGEALSGLRGAGHAVMLVIEFRSCWSFVNQNGRLISCWWIS
jgi:hypothetical protein